MKYVNHLNAIIAIVALIIIVQTLGKTFWQSEPEAPPTLDVPQAQPIVASPPVRPAPAPFAPGRASQYPATPAEGEEQTANPQATPLGGVASQPQRPAGVLPSSGNRAETQFSIVGRPGGQPGATVGAQPSAPIQRPTRRNTMGQPRSSTFIPPSSANTTPKRQPGDNTNPRVPPTRGSMPQQ